MKGESPVPPGSVPAWLSQRRLFVALALMVAGTWLWRMYASEAPPAPIAYSQFYALLTDGKVRSVVMSGEAIDATLKNPETVDGRTVTTVHTTAAATIRRCCRCFARKACRSTSTASSSPSLVQLMLSLLPWALIIGFWVWMSRRAKTMIGAGNPFGGMAKNQSRKFDKTTSVNVTFEDIAGLKAAKRDLQEVVQFLKEPDRFQRLGGKVPRGVLLIGPPGTGKTLLARAVAGESGVPFFSISASEFIEMFVGLGAARVRDLFRDAKKSAPAIVFIDEIDAVGRARGAGLGGGNDEREQTLNQLLSEMDGFERTDLVVVIAATNRPDVLDPALLRPGRFDRRVLVDRPELAARKAILDVHAKGKPLALDVNLQVVAQNTPGFSGADLANLVNEAALSATREGRREHHGGGLHRGVRQDRPRRSARGEAGRQGEATRRGPRGRPRGRRARFRPTPSRSHRVSIIPRGMALGVTQQSPGADRHVMAEAELESRLRVLMGGYAAERLVLASISTGAENDLKEATRLASRMVAHFGMSERLGPVYYDHDAEHPFLGHARRHRGGNEPRDHERDRGRGAAAPASRAG